ncbi:MAG: hypothetical protein WKG07_39620 [Hymenobacter sp.]
MRGTDTTGRLAEARRRWAAGSTLAALAGVVVAIGAGSFIFYNANILNQYQRAQAGRKAASAIRKAVPPPQGRGPAAHRGRGPEHRHLP